MKKLIYLFFLLLISNSFLAQRVQDSLALVALYKSTNGIEWWKKTNWLSSKPISTWYGVTLTNNRVTHIDLHWNKLSGKIPPEIGYLTTLDSLNLSRNRLKGSIPKEIGNLHILHLYLSNNKLAGSIPKEIFNCFYREEQIIDEGRILDLSNRDVIKVKI